jgi:dTDP-4-amino-4,6-dideoxygalactose transaminase
MGSLIPILYQGGVPVFADLHPHSYEMLPESVDAAITPRTRAVLAVHLWGNACDLNALTQICERHDLALIEDCAQALGCCYEGRPIGTIGHIGCFSLNEYKHINCGDGGLVITDDPDLAHRLRSATDKGYDRAADSRARDSHFLCNNYRMTELQGAVGVAQLRKLDSIVARRRTWCSALSERLQGLEGLTPPEVTPGCEPSWWFYLMRMDPDVLGADRPTFVQALRAEGLIVGEGYLSRPVYEYPIFTDHSAFARGSHPYSRRQYGRGLCPTTEQILDTALMFSVNQAYTETDLDETVLGIQRVYRWYHNQATAP